MDSDRIDWLAVVAVTIALAVFVGWAWVISGGV